jgi:N-acetyl-gamma-glutamyl-phosphate reductase
MVAGASGFAGALAAELVWRHPRMELVLATSRSDAGTELRRLYPRYRAPVTLKELILDDLEDIDAAIVAYPHGASAPVVAALRGLGIQVVDLSADFRLGDMATYQRWYGEHGAPELLEGAVYGLPELHREAIREAELVANPGCYPTASILALAPLARAGLIDDVVIDAKSGVSGAGRGKGDSTHFVTVDENVTPYKVTGHRHQPEIAEQIGQAVTFIPHLVPLDQGELASCYVRPTREVSQAEIDEIYSQAYDEEPFVEVVDWVPGMREVRDTNLCRIHALVREDRLLVFSVIDNLWKGASSQAIQNLNLMLGFEEGEGLL